ncbi:hypothetical protein F0562_033691 [Nyssa sinensis]|uniref:Response regulatory domain-containing protein n=1 Tax=Nyssa sinensis TaxID=561372 RepID=A0A5J5AG00_9ASTE|nr:hypothetical protein F0562_033691 [Nyssa sinensis]
MPSIREPCWSFPHSDLTARSSIDLRSTPPLLDPKHSELHLEKSTNISPISLTHHRDYQNQTAQQSEKPEVEEISGIIGGGDWDFLTQIQLPAIELMAKNGMFSRRKRSEKIEGFDLLPSDSHEVHVLAVDDSLVDRKVIERLLKISSCKVTAVDSGRRALQFLGLDEEKNSVDFDGLKVDLIITDYCMPGMTGYELLKKIKESSTFREIPVVIMSSENCFDTDRQVFGGRCRRFYSKTGEIVRRQTFERLHVWTGSSGEPR